MKKKTLVGLVLVGSVITLTVGRPVYQSVASERNALDKIETVEKSFTKSDKHLEELISSEMIRKNKKVSDEDINNALIRLEAHVTESKDLSKDLENTSKEVQSQLGNYEEEMDSTKEKISNVKELLNVEKELSELLGKEIRFTPDLIKGDTLVTVSKLDRDKLIDSKDKIKKELNNKKVKDNALVVLDKAIDNTQKRMKVNQIIKEIEELSKEGADFSEKEKELLGLTNELKDEDLNKSVSKELDTAKQTKNTIIEEQKEVERIVQEEAQAATVQAESKTSDFQGGGSQEVSKSNSGLTQETKEVSAPKPVTTDGFNFNGYSFPIGSWSGAGGELVPADGFIYSWTGMSNHYLIERMGSAGGPILSVQVGTQIIINGQSFTVSDMTYASNLDGSGFDWVSNHKGSGITFQTCADASGDTLILWHAV